MEVVCIYNIYTNVYIIQNFHIIIYNTFLLNVDQNIILYIYHKIEDFTYVLITF